MSIKRAILAGHGPSLKDHTFDPDIPVYAISGAAMELETMRGMITIVEARHFPAHLVKNPDIEKHVPKFTTSAIFGTSMIKGGWIGDWQKFDNVQAWDYSHLDGEPFKQPFTQGPMLNSFLFSVQVIDALGFHEIQFVGVDCIDDNWTRVIDMLENWEPLAKAKWVNASGKESRLSQFMQPIDQAVMV